MIENNKNNYNQLYKNMYSEYTVHIQNNTLIFLINNDTFVSNSASINKSGNVHKLY
jgi:hypothetical protein